MAGHLLLQTTGLALERSGTAMWIPALLALVGVAMLWRGTVVAGLGVLWLSKCVQCVQVFPFTPNHYYLEAALVTGLLLTHEPEEEPRFARLVNTALVSLYFYSGLQKLAHGMWHQGEYLGLVWSLPPTGNLSRVLRWLLGAPPTLADDFATLPFECSRAAMLVLMGLAWSVLLLELSCGICLAFDNRARGGALQLMLGFGLLLGPLTGEWSFMFVHLACLVLLLPNSASRWFWALLASDAIYQVLRLLL